MSIFITAIWLSLLALGDAFAQAPGATQPNGVNAAGNLAVDKEAGPLRRELANLAPLRQSDPGRYVEQALKIVDALEAVADHHQDASYSIGVRTDVLSERRVIALLQRFALQQPLKSLVTNQKIFAPQRPGEGGDFRAALQIAEIYRYELRDKVKALEYYQKARDAVDREHWQGVRDPDVIATWTKEGLIDKEIDYLKRGRPFSGAMTRRDLEGAGLALFDGLGLLMLIAPSLGEGSASPLELIPHPGADRAVLARLQRMPPSYLTAVATILDVNGTTNAAATVELLKRSDPVHYLSACVLGIVAANANQGSRQEARGGAQRDEATVLRQVIAQFGRANNIEVHTDPDHRRATPQATWELFIASLKSGDRDTALTCFTGPLRAALSELFRKSSNAELRQMANEFGPLLPPAAGTDDSKEFQEFGVTRRLPQGDQAALVDFVRVGDEWVVQSM
jgi:hypothetical protein